MAKYDYKCPECGNEVELEHSIHTTVAPEDLTCGSCGAQMYQVYRKVTYRRLDFADLH